MRYWKRSALGLVLGLGLRLENVTHAWMTHGCIKSLLLSYMAWKRSLVPRPHPLTRKGAWWPLSNFLVVPSQQNATSHVTWVVQQRRGWGLGMRLQIDRSVEHMVAWRSAISLGCSVSRLLTRHNQEIAQWSPDPFLVRGWGLGTRLWIQGIVTWTIP